MTAEFDRHRHTYRGQVQRSIDFIGQDVDFFIEAKARHVFELARRWLGRPEKVRVLDVGCGVGLTDAHLEGRFRSLSGVDVAEGVVAEAAARNPWAEYRSYGGKTLPFPGDSFDLSFAICVLHHVGETDRARFAAEMARVTRPGGIVAVFDHNPLNPLTRLAVGRCEFDDDCELVGRRRTRDILDAAGLETVDLRYILFFPWRGGGFRRAEGTLGWLPLGAQYLVAARRPGSVASGAGRT